MELLYKRYSLQQIQAFNQKSYSKIQEILADKSNHGDNKVSEELQQLEATLEDFRRIVLENFNADSLVLGQDKFHHWLSQAIMNFCSHVNNLEMLILNKNNTINQDWSRQLDESKENFKQILMGINTRLKPFTEEPSSQSVKIISDLGPLPPLADTRKIKSQ